MRRSIGIFVLCQVLILGSLVYSVRWLLVLLVDTGISDAIKPFEIPGVNSTSTAPMHDDRPERIPRILHQTWKNDTIPAIWEEPHASCLKLHKTYEYMLWTDASARDFIVREYPWFLDQFDKYTYNIERADAIRYFVLLHYGGVYIDLDDGCARPLDPLLSYGAFVRKTKPTGISNDIMGAIPGHPFFRAAVENLRPMARDWYMPYLTVMASTGPLFLSLVWLWYKRQPYNDPEVDRVRILWGDEYMGKPWSFFLHYQGSSWHDGDSGLFFWMKRHWIALFIIGWIIGLSAIAGLWVLSQRVQRRGRRSSPPGGSSSRKGFRKRAHTLELPQHRRLLRRSAPNGEEAHEADIDDSSDGGASSGGSGSVASCTGGRKSSLAVKLARLATTAAARSGYSTDTTAAGGDDSSKGGYEKVEMGWLSSSSAGSGRLSPALSTASTATTGSGHGHFINALLQAASGATGSAGGGGSAGGDRDDSYAQLKALEAGEISQRRQQQQQQQQSSSPALSSPASWRPASAQPGLRNERYSRDGLFSD